MSASPLPAQPQSNAEAERSAWRALAAFLTIAWSTAALGATDDVIPMVERSWFAPKATTVADPFCKTVEDATRTAYLGSGEMDLMAGLGRKVVAAIDGERYGTPVADTSNTVDLEPHTGVPLLRRWVEESGCGQACNRFGLQFARKGEPESAFEQKAHGTPLLETEWGIVRDGRGRLFALGSDVQAVYVYRIEPSGVLEHACDIATRPDLDHLPASVAPAKRSLDALYVAASRVQGTEGDCGSSHTLSRWKRRLHTALMATLYQPWALHGPDDPPSANSGGDYDRIEQQLELWSLGGEYEHRAHAGLIGAKRAATADLASTYRAKFRWPSGVAARAAETAVRRALAQGFGFYLYDPYPAEVQIRRAILQRRSMNEIRAIEFELDESARDPDDEFSDGLAATAIGYPDALRYLLERGVDPNRPNGFGKTALMTAVQYNQLESVKILLDHGADVNAVIGGGAVDRCFYALSSSGRTTALHYAARYASGDIIRLLVERGANIHAVADRYDAGAAQPAADWLHVYTLGADRERNPNVSASEVPALLELLGAAR